MRRPIRADHVTLRGNSPQRHGAQRGFETLRTPRTRRARRWQGSAKRFPSVLRALRVSNPLCVLRASVVHSLQMAMRFGLFGSAQAPRDAAALARGYHDFVEWNVEAAPLGYHASFLVEHHFTGLGQVSASLTLLTWVAARTRTLRVGTAVLVLPWHNPVLLAEQAATLDLLSGGRLDFGVGKGYRRNEFDGFCMRIEDAEA